MDRERLQSKLLSNVQLKLSELEEEKQIISATGELFSCYLPLPSHDCQMVLRVELLQDNSERGRERRARPRRLSAIDSTVSAGLTIVAQEEELMLCGIASNIVYTLQDSEIAEDLHIITRNHPSDPGFGTFHFITFLPSCCSCNMQTRTNGCLLYLVTSQCHEGRSPLAQSTKQASILKNLDSSCGSFSPLREPLERDTSELCYMRGVTLREVVKGLSG